MLFSAQNPLLGLLCPTSQCIFFNQVWWIIVKFDMVLTDICGNVTGVFILPLSYFTSNQRIFNPVKLLLEGKTCYKNFLYLHQYFLIFLFPKNFFSDQKKIYIIPRKYIQIAYCGVREGGLRGCLTVAIIFITF